MMCAFKKKADSRQRGRFFLCKIRQFGVKAYRLNKPSAELHDCSVCSRMKDDGPSAKTDDVDVLFSRSSHCPLRIGLDSIPQNKETFTRSCANMAEASPSLSSSAAAGELLSLLPRNACCETVRTTVKKLIDGCGFNAKAAEALVAAWSISDAGHMAALRTLPASPPSSDVGSQASEEAAAEEEQHHKHDQYRRNQYQHHHHHQQHGQDDEQQEEEESYYQGLDDLGCLLETLPTDVGPPAPPPLHASSSSASAVANTSSSSSSKGGSKEPIFVSRLGADKLCDLSRLYVCSFLQPRELLRISETCKVRERLGAWQHVFVHVE